MTDSDLRDQIARIEAEIEQLGEGLDRCRKAMLFAKLAIAAGGILILAYFLGATWFEPATMIGALAAILGGVVILGSNSSTSKQITVALKAAEIRRAELIDMVNPRVIGASRNGL
jgi:hypothetical protein